MRHEPKLVDMAAIEWRGHLRVFWTLAAVLAVSAAGFVISMVRPEWLTQFFAMVGVAAFICLGISASVLMEFRREQRLWFMNRPARRRR